MTNDLGHANFLCSSRARGKHDRKRDKGVITGTQQAFYGPVHIGLVPYKVVV